MKKLNAFIGLASLGLILSSCGYVGGDPNHEHRWGVPSYSWASDYSSCTASRVCELDSAHTDSETVTPSYEVTVQATTSSDGEGVYTATFSKDYFITQTKTVVIPPIGHTHTYSDEWEFNNTHHWHPSSCGHDVVDDYEEHDFISSTVDGVTTYTCECGYCYSVGGEKFLEYKDNPDLLRLYPELNTALKTLLNSKNFTMERTQRFENAQYYYPYSDVKPLVFINGELHSYAKFDHKDFETSISFTGEVYLSLDQVLALFEVSSWDVLINNSQKYMDLRNYIYSTLSDKSDIYTLASSIDLKKATISGGKIVVLKDVSQVGAQFFDTNNEQQYYIIKQGEESTSRYIVPDNWAYQNIDVKYSVLEQLNFYASRFKDYETNHIIYDPDTHSYNREIWGSGASRFDMRYVCPIVVENGEVTSFKGMAITNIGTTSITTEKVLPSCQHRHGTHQYWFSDEYHGDYCDDCGKVISKRKHTIHNNHDICTECMNFSNGLWDDGFDYYQSQYQDLLGDHTIYINPKTGKKYMYFYESEGSAVTSITGKDGVVYQYFSSIPTDGNVDEIRFETKDTKETSHIEDNCCIYCLKYELIKDTYTATYTAISEENVPEIYDGRPSEYYTSHYFHVEKSFVAKEILETIYAMPGIAHEDLSSNNSFKAITFEECLNKCNDLYEEFKYHSSSQEELPDFKCVETKCNHCNMSLYGVFMQSSEYEYECYLQDFNGVSIKNHLQASYEWNRNQTECVATLSIEANSGEDSTILLVESGVVVDDSTNHMFIATFANPLLDTQYYYYY